MFVEIVLIQKLILLLGQVVYSTALVIFTMLVFSGIGSLVSQKIKRIKVLMACIACLIVFYSFMIPLLINSLIKFGLITRFVFAGILIAPLAFLMGMPFPLGIRRINKKLISWAFGVNGAASVLSTRMVILIALSEQLGTLCFFLRRHGFAQSNILLFACDYSFYHYSSWFLL